MVCPNLEVVTQPVMLGVYVINEDYFLALITIPPLVGVLAEKPGVLSANSASLSSSCWSIVPLVREGIDAGM